MSLGHPWAIDGCQILVTAQHQRATDRAALLRRLKALPLVCKRWARILGRPSAVWEDIDIDLVALRKRADAREDGLPYLDAQVVSAWFAR